MQVLLSEIITNREKTDSYGSSRLSAAGQFARARKPCLYYKTTMSMKSSRGFIALLLACAVVSAYAPVATAASSPSPSAANSTVADLHGGHGSHPHYSLTYLVFMLFVGALCYQFDKAIPLPYTVTLLLCGIIIGLVHEATDKGLGTLSDSIDQWLLIDPHLLLFTFLPALLFGDAIGMEFASIRKAFGQMLILATAGTHLPCRTHSTRSASRSPFDIEKKQLRAMPTPRNIFLFFLFFFSPSPIYRYRRKPSPSPSRTKAPEGFLFGPIT